MPRLSAALCAALLAHAAGADRLELSRYTDLWTGSPVRSADASGVTWVAARGHLLIAFVADFDVSAHSADPEVRGAGPDLGAVERWVGLR